MTAAMLMYRNTPDRDTGLSPAQVLYAHQLRDTVPTDKSKLRLRPEWVLTLERREAALARRHQVRGRELSKGTKVQTALEVGQTVQVQNQRGPHANKWDLSGTVVEIAGNDAYIVKMDGSGRVTRRNRQFLKPIRGYTEILRDSVKKQAMGGHNVTSNVTMHDAGTGATADSARGVFLRNAPPPISGNTRLEHVQREGPGGRTAD